MPQSTDAQQRDKYVSQLKIFRDRLLDINARNPSILVRKPTKKACLDLHGAASAAADALFQKIASGSGECYLLPDSDESPGATEARASLTQLSRNASARAEETGLHDLFVGFCWLEGFIAPDVFVRAPLLMVPVTLTARRKERRSGWYATIDDGTARLNRSLLAALRKHKGFSTEESLEETIQGGLGGTADAKPSEETAYENSASAWIQAGLACTPAPFDRGTRVSPLKKEDIGRLKGSALSIKSYLAIGMFPQTSTSLFADLDEMLKRAMAGETDQGIVDNLLEAPADDPSLNLANFAEVKLDEVADEKLNLVVPSDPSQDAVVVRAQAADCVVVRGPPGTGKSQVIVNLVADALSRGGRVLVVCQKRAALDVVHSRLKDVGLSEHTYLVHDEATDRPSLLQQMHRGLSASQEAAPALTSERSTTQLSRSIDADIASIRKIVEPLRSPFRGITLSSLYRRARHKFASKVDATSLPEHEDELAGLVDIAKKNQATFLKYEAPSSPVALRQSWTDFGHDDKSAMLQALEELRRFGGRQKHSEKTALMAQIKAQIRRIDSEEERKRLGDAVTTYVRLSIKWFRFLVPSWWSARRVVGRARRFYGDLPVSEWGDVLRETNELYKTIAAASLMMQARWRDAALELIERREELGIFAERLSVTIANEFEKIQQHDALKAANKRFVGAILHSMERLSHEEDWGDHLLQATTLRFIDEAEKLHPVLRGNPLQRNPSAAA